MSTRPGAPLLGAASDRTGVNGAAPRAASAASEQAWNEERLAAPVTRPAWRAWRYERPAIVLGCSQRRMLDGLPAPGAAGSVEVLLRRSGGGAVLVGPWMLGLSVALPPDHALVLDGPVPSYRWLGLCLARVLNGFGVRASALAPAEVSARSALRGTTPARAGSDPDADPDADPRDGARDDAAADPRWACFAGLSPWEAVVGDRKITGLAQVRRRTGVLLVAGVLVDRPDWAMLCAVLRRPAAEADTLARITTSCVQEGAVGIDAAALSTAVDAAIAEILADRDGMRIP